MLTGLLLTLNVLVCLALIGVVLLQKSEGGALGSGGSPTGLITSRGAGDLLTRTTWVLFTVFLCLSLTLTLLGGHARSDSATLARLKALSINPDAHPAVPAAAKAPATGQSGPTPVQLPPLTGSSGSAPRVAPSPTTAPANASPLALPPLAPEGPAKPTGAP